MTHFSRRQFLAKAAATGALATVPSLLLPTHPVSAATHATITAGKRTIEVNGRAATVFGLTQADGKHGLVMDAGRRFRVRLDNRTGEETVIHWHGLTPPWRQDGVGGISQEPIPAGRPQDYDFLVTTPGTFWMHSHLGLQGQRMLAAPLIVRNPAEAADDVQEVVVLFHDFTFRDPEEILAGLKGSGHASMPGMKMDSGGQMDHSGMSGMDSGGGMVGMDMGGMSHLQDVEYDALLANDRTLDDPEVFSVEQGGRVRLRLINGAASTNMWIDLGRLRGRLIAVDGMPVQPIDGYPV
jgi:FtsP/CotA-like multicopper oxidase with cupredoxin domain